MSASGTVVLVFQEQVFKDLAFPKVTTYPGRGFSAGVCFGVVAFSFPHTEKFPRVKSWAFHTFIAATVSAEEPRSGGQTLVCVSQVKESAPLMMKYLDCLETTLDVLVSFSYVLHHFCVVCLPEGNSLRLISQKTQSSLTVEELLDDREMQTVCRSMIKNKRVPWMAE